MAGGLHSIVDMLLPWILLIAVVLVAVIGGVSVARRKLQDRMDHMHRGPR